MERTSCESCKAKLVEPKAPIFFLEKVQVDDKNTSENSTVLVMIEDLYKFEMEKYMIMWKIWKIKNESWSETNGMIYNLVLNHYSKVLESLLKS